MSLACPHYIEESSIKDAPPGHRFKLYFTGWKDDLSLDKDHKYESLQPLESIPKHSIKLLDSLRKRQSSLARLDAKRSLIISAVSQASFVTGMGMEHPLENGFAFLDPYGLPYLPGSSIKGVIRRAAEELAIWAPESGWTLARVWWLFGFDSNSAFFADERNVSEFESEEIRRWKDAYSRSVLNSNGDKEMAAFLETTLEDRIFAKVKNDIPTFLTSLMESRGRPIRNSIAVRGSLCFWDVIPKPRDGRLQVDIMNPHHGDYYQNGNPPGDWEDPNPIFFLSIPAGSEFRFVARLEPIVSLPASIRGALWRDMLKNAFDPAFEWLGFGAKTSLGYGRMREDSAAEAAAQKEAEQQISEEAAVRKRQEAERQQKLLEAMSPHQKLVHELKTQSPDKNRVMAIYQHLQQFSGEEQKELAAGLRAAFQRLGDWDGNHLTEKQQKKVAAIRQILGETL